MLSLLGKYPQLKIQKVRHRAHKISTTYTDTFHKQQFLHVPLLVSQLRTASPVICALIFSQKIFCMYCLERPPLCFMLRPSSYFSSGHKNGTAGFSCLDFKLSPCSLCNMFSFGYFPGVWGLKADVSEPSIGSIFIDRWRKNDSGWDVCCIYTRKGCGREVAYFPVVWVLKADVSEPSIGSIFIGRWRKNSSFTCLVRWNR